MEQKQKMIKKSKDMILEVPDYFTHEELIELYGKRKKDNPDNTMIMQNDHSALSFDYGKMAGNMTNLDISKFKDEMDDDMGDINEHQIRSNMLLEDLFLKNQAPKKSVSDPFHKDFLNITRGDASFNGVSGINITKTYDDGNKSQLFSTVSKYSRLPNGMIINTDVSEMKRQNDMLAKVNAYVANNKSKNGEVHMPFGMIDSKSMAEFYTDLFTYSPAILRDALHQGDEFERFKMTLKFGFSILHNLTFQDVFQKKPLMPILGETYEGHYIQSDITNVFMESDYVAYDYVDLLSLKDVVINKELATTYIQIESSDKSSRLGQAGTFEISGNLTYDYKMRGNNLVIGLPGVLRVRFPNMEGDDQIVEIQLPEYVLSEYYYVGKPSMILINGPLVVVDKKNQLKSVVLF